MMRYAIVKDGVVVNVILWDGEDDYAPDGLAVQSDEAGIGWTYDGELHAPEPPEE